MRSHEDQWADRKKQIADDTEVTIETSKKAIVDATHNAKFELKEIQRSIEEAQKSFKSLQDNQHKLVLEVEQSIKDLQHEQKVLSHTNAGLQEENRTLKSEIDIRKESVESLKHTEETLSNTLAELGVQQEQVEDKLVKLRLDFQTKTTEFQELETTINGQIDVFNTDISKLEARREALAQEIVQNRAQDEAVRKNLADWAKKLDGQDKNLRIRESKVNEQEKAIARNYNLLNL